MNLLPNADELWEGIGGTFDIFTEVIAEPTDNAISNIIANNVFNSSIVITVNEDYEDMILVKIEDSGTGIKNLESALTFGSKKCQEYVLNEHGFGLKHSLASANPINDCWAIYTKTKKDLCNGIYKVVKAPYRFDKKEEIIVEKDNPWPGVFEGTGTIVEFKCSKEFFNTIQKGINGKAGFIKCLDYLCEDLGFLYSGYILNGKINIIVRSESSDYNKKVSAVRPEWVGYYKPNKGIENVDLGGGIVKIQYIFGEIKESEYIKYYQKNQSTCGAEIRINGRVVLKNVFKDIWQLENHPHYNHFLACFNIISEVKERLPRTKTNKSGIRIGDEKFEKLYQWIRSIFPTPPRSLSGAVSEKELIEKLELNKNTHIDNPVKCIQKDFLVFNKVGCPVKLDLYVFDGFEISIYEAKKDVADVQDLYQLIMYWDGCVLDGINPNKGKLIASSFPKGLESLVKEVNQSKDKNGNMYNIILTTWKDELVDYPV